MTFPVLMYLPLVGLLLWAAGEDIVRRRIPNWLTFAMILGGIGQSFLPGGTVTPLMALAGLGAGFALTFVMFAIAAMGAGDVKLMAGVGAWVGPWPVLLVFAGAALVGVVLVVVQALVQGRLVNVLRNTTLLIVNLLHIRELGTEHVAATGQSCQGIDKPLPYAVPVLVATVGLLVMTALRS